MCKVHSLELVKIRSDLHNKSAYSYLLAVSQMQRNAKILYKKISKNEVVRKAFKEVMVSRNHFSEEVTLKIEYILDLLLVNILDQIFIQIVVEANMSDILACLNFELKNSVVPESVSQISEKREGIQKIFKLINSIEEN